MYVRVFCPAYVRCSSVSVHDRAGRYTVSLDVAEFLDQADMHN